MNGLVPSMRRANRPRTPRVIRVSNGAVVSSFAIGDADGMDGGQVDDIEAHGSDVGQARLAIFEAAMLPWGGCAGTWKHLVPGAEACFGAIDYHCELWAVGGSQGS